MLDFWQDYPEIRGKLIAVQTLMAERLSVNNADIRDALQKFTTRGGKMVRPALFFLFSGLLK
ncbi:MAG TPA: farnesyl pyrophosphate synthetase, partial [Lactococcus sp.]|nr:farnesyl pyrophosphate synthetase [Lactococcus sp.]